MFCIGNLLLQIFALEDFVKACPVGLTDSYKTYISIYIYILTCVETSDFGCPVVSEEVQAGTEIPGGWGEEGGLHLSLHCHHQNDS